MAKANTHVIEKSAEEILSPKPYEFTAAGKTHKIYPMPDGVLMTVADSMGEIIGLLQGASRIVGDGVKLDIKDVLPVLPQIVKILLPNSTKIIAAALRADEEWVQDTLRLADRLRALRCIMLAEDVAALVGEWQALAEAATPPAPTAGSESEATD